MTDESNTKRQWKDFFGPNLGYIQEQYEQFSSDPESVDASFRELFAELGAPPAELGAQPSRTAPAAGGQVAVDATLLKKLVAAEKLVGNIRTYGHLAANTDPLGLRASSDTRLLEPSTFELNESDLSRFPASLLWDHAPAGVSNGWEAIQKLRNSYTQSIGFEFSHVHDETERDWLSAKAESGIANASLNVEERKSLLNLLLHVEQFESYLHRTFVGQKRFSVEGVDMLIPVIDEIVRQAVQDGASHILMGMAHRGRLNVLAHVLGKPYEKIFSEFHHAPNKELVPSEGSVGINSGWAGDVKYHLGADRSVAGARILLANNPSHLEYVNSVVEGFSRAAQEDRTQPGFPRRDPSKSLAIQVHGDAAFPGEGIVAETLNFTGLDGFTNGGSIHIIANNRIGFTTDSKDSRSTHYASDLAKGYEIPIVHVNADDPEACIAAVRLACEYRDKFKKDFLIDLVGYRRYGHNEMDDPEGTQPLVYEKVRAHKTVATLYAERLKAEGALSAADIDRMIQDTQAELQKAYDVMKEQAASGKRRNEGSIPDAPETTETAVPLERLKEINAALLQVPDGFTVYPKLQRILQRRGSMLDEGEKVDWALAETLALATILADGKPIRMSGQDAERATFSHRHIVLNDHKTGEKFSPMHHFPQAKASFAVYNSPLTEGAVLGFEYGYNVFSPETFTIWEAQYGDFANAAQVIFDQFISAGRTKWKQRSSLAMLLPHGYEGQGPEHSSARLERFLQLSAENNWTVANLSTAAQYFHLLRRQAAWTEHEGARPLVLMSPKSLIRNPRVLSPGSELASGSFKLVLEQQGLGKKASAVRRLILCTGKVAVDLEEALDSAKDQDMSWLHIVRVEQLYPFPAKEIAEIISRYSKLEEIVWVQEEPKNMGAWTFMEPRIRELAGGKAVHYIGRPDRSSPASGHQEVHAAEQQSILSLSLQQKALNTILLGR
ncbi:2-oxoglutarate dehydrogenase E1 component [Paenibacillus pasadenensis]|uniref:2-oxoglutarate dehydrogenase E1 component n=1 Tax=Paenibacillus pasadenensis TaxID=217090 RepID=A0A2N5N626_9BACL|nr:MULTISPECIES: 2-oxoglutarate dehydrogenase E1 component [Paenibacillus]PLT45760.1 2-oxoglutarate dehydrogenase E1 component [Paenibacillus pasadenensis]QGG56195.1 2-oxoglutarate dehydrogenase E1 component [Paenibacillus sp. B01]